jgi:hypothetical protein
LSIHEGAMLVVCLVLSSLGMLCVEFNLSNCLA